MRLHRVYLLHSIPNRSGGTRSVRTTFWNEIPTIELRITLCTISCCVSRNEIQFAVIRTFGHKGLERFFETGSLAGIRPSHAKRLRMLLAVLDTAKSAADTAVPGFRLHSLKGTDNDRWSIRVSGNWRVTFEFKDGQVYRIDYEDYH